MTFTKPSHPLEAVPVCSASVTAQPQSGGGVLLRLRLHPQGRLPAWLARLFGSQEIRLVLDEAGARFWRSIDDCRSLRDICRMLSPKSVDRDLETAVIRYTADLMNRGFLHLAVSAPPAP